jgi:feruloyl esterase
MISSLALVVLGTMAAATPCENLKTLSLPNTTITTSQLVMAGSPFPGARGGAGGPGRGAAPAPDGAPAPDAPATGAPAGARGGRGGAPAAPATTPVNFCRIVAVLKPSSDSNINVEVWMPEAEKWNGKFQAEGNGGWAGSIQGFAAMQTAIRAGYATAGTDTGHTVGNGSFTVGHPEQVIDFGYRAIHEMTVQSKALIKEFYGKSETLSYFVGCSTGGRQALMEAQRYPNDFDGIIAGAPANDHINLHAGDMSRQIDIYKDPAGYLNSTKVATLAAAVMNACDELDGVKDGLISDPRQCKFKPQTLLCKGDDSDSCLTAAQVKTIERAYAPAKTSKGELLFPGFSFGGESTYAVLRGNLPARVPAAGAAPTAPPAPPVPATIGWDTFRYLGHQDATWDWRNFNIDVDPALAMKNAGAIINSTDPDLSKFKAHGGKLILYHGWADQLIQPEHTVLYYNSVLDKMGKKQDDWLTLFLVAGMGHCGGGAANSPNTYDTIGAMDAWRDKGKAPLPMTGSNAQAGLSRPLCPYPQVAKYSGTGSTNDAANFSCKAP